MSRLLSVSIWKDLTIDGRFFYFGTFHDSRRRFQEGCGGGSERQENRELNFYHLKMIDFIKIHILSACLKDERTRWTRRVLKCRKRKKPGPCHSSLPHVVTTEEFLGPPEHYNIFSPTPYREKAFICLSLTRNQYTNLIQSANDLQRPLSSSLHPGYKNGPRTHVQCGLFLSGSQPDMLPVSVPSPTLINFILLSFCLLSGNSFPTHPWATTVSSESKMCNLSTSAVNGVCVCVCVCVRSRTRAFLSSNVPSQS